jgi:hypothetical protein
MKKKIGSSEGKNNEKKIIGKKYLKKERNFFVFLQ